MPRLLTVGMAWTALAVVAYWFWRMGRSRYGRALEAIREDELAARSMGIDVGRHRLAAFVTAGAVAGLYGVLYAYYVRLIAPGDFDFVAAVEGLVTAVVGGSTMFLGPLLGSGFQTMIPEIQRAVGVEAGWIRPFLASVLLLVVILFLPGGLASLIPRRTRMPAAGAGRRRPRAPLTTRRHPAPGEIVATLAGLGKEYGGVHAVRNIDLEVRSGEVVGLIGPNGAGKTTLVNMISGLVPPSSGSATVLGVPIGRTPVHKVAAAGVSRTFQHSKLFNRLSALGERPGGRAPRQPAHLPPAAAVAALARRDEQAALEHAARCLRRVGLADTAGNRASALSYGDQRRLEIARALASDPSLLILDEPAAGMNHVEAAKLSALITSLAADGLTILFIEHNVGMVLETCTRVVVLNFGAGHRQRHAGRRSPPIPWSSRPTSAPRTRNRSPGRSPKAPSTTRPAARPRRLRPAPSRTWTHGRPARWNHRTRPRGMRRERSHPRRGRICGSATGGSRPSAASRSGPSRVRW